MNNEFYHRACAELLMDEYGIPKEHREEIVQEIEKIWHPSHMPHFVIIRSIRGFVPLAKTRTLENLLEQLKTHPAKHKKGEYERKPEYRGKYSEPSYD